MNAKDPNLSWAAVGWNESKGGCTEGWGRSNMFENVLGCSISFYIHVSMNTQEFMTDPQQLMAQAQNEPSRRGLDGYSDTIQLLKEGKGFSFREIAAWLGKRGIKVDHNAVWRAYSKVNRKGTGDRNTERIERFERNAAKDEAMPWLEGA